MRNKLKLTIPWEEIEEGAQDQIIEALTLPFLEELVILPDVHQGYDLPIGSVALLDNHIWAGAVGYDIGCGMCHINTKINVEKIPPGNTVYDRITDMVPTGFTERKTLDKSVTKFPNASEIVAVADAVRYKAASQLGTLGGGNHFIEVGYNKNHEVGITIHSGSRRPGWLIADYHMRVTQGPVETRSKKGMAYFTDMNWALEYALENRSVMMEKCLFALGIKDTKPLMKTMINENHNHAEMREDGVLHRKGATPALKGQLGIIPANMRDGVWITKGLGNEDFLSSASHGAGRAMSRCAARKTLDSIQFQFDMLGIETPNLKDLLDEAPEAYKDIHKVIAIQDGVLVEVIDHFKPLVVVKG